jgi:tRNA A37 N6-isopentenylltransferase MiaA
MDGPQGNPITDSTPYCLDITDFLLHFLTLLCVYSEPDYTKGIFQAIGFKEFHQYLLLSEEDRNSEKGSKLFHAGVDALKLVTKRYARRQLRWIKNRFLRKTTRQVG